MMSAQPESFEAVRDRLEQIVDEVNAEGITLDQALSLYEEAVKLGLSACDLSEQGALEAAAQIDAQQGGSSSADVEGEASGPSAGSDSDASTTSVAEASAEADGAVSGEVRSTGANGLKADAGVR